MIPSSTDSTIVSGYSAIRRSQSVGVVTAVIVLSRQAVANFSPQADGLRHSVVGDSRVLDPEHHMQSLPDDVAQAAEVGGDLFRRTQHDLAPPRRHPP